MKEAGLDRQAEDAVEGEVVGADRLPDGLPEDSVEPEAGGPESEHGALFDFPNVGRPALEAVAEVDAEGDAEGIGEDGEVSGSESADGDFADEENDDEEA